MSNEKVAQVGDAPEPKTAAEWQQKVADYDITLAGTLGPAIRTAIEKLRADAVQRKFLAEITAPTVKVDAPVQQFVTPKVPDTMPPSVAENLKMWDGQIAEVETFLKNNPLPQLIPGAKELLAEKKASRAKVLHDFQNPAPIPIPPPPPPIALPPEVIELVQSIVRAQVPSIVAEVVAWFKNNREWLQS
jgi:hypothetical protein